MAAVDPKFYEKKVATMLEGRYEADEGDGQPQLAELEFTFVDVACRSVHVSGLHLGLCIAGGHGSPCKTCFYFP